MSQTIRAVVVQDAPSAFDLEKSLDRVFARLREAAAQGAQLAVFPEAFLPGYPKGADFGVRVGWRTPEGRELYRQYFEQSVELPGPISARLGAAAKEHRLHLVIGVVERERSTLYCTVAFFGLDGSLLGKHRKLMPTAMERVIWGMGDGSTLPVFDTPIGRLGAVICWENYMPLLRAAMYAQGIEIYCMPTVDDRETWLATARHVALEGRCFVLSACQFARRADFPSLGSAGQPADALIRGGSCIIGPLGEILAGPAWDGPGILAADLDPAALTRARFDFDPAGHYRRPDVFTLKVNTAPQPGAEFATQGKEGEGG